MGCILIVDGHESEVTIPFESEVRPGLPKKTTVDVVQGASAAKERLAETNYPIVLVEHMVVEPVSLKFPPVDPAELQKRLAQGEKVTLSMAGLTAANIDNVIRPAYTILPEFFKIRPKADFIIVSHGRGIGVGKHLPKYQAFPQVVGVFGGISSKGTAGKILDLIRSRLG